MLAEAIAALIETDLAGGSTIIATTELDTLRTEAAEASTDTRIVSVHCTCDSTMTRPLPNYPSATPTASPSTVAHHCAAWTH